MTTTTTTAKNHRLPDPKQLIREARELVRQLEDAELREQRADLSAREARKLADRRRLELGQHLCIARKQWPARGPKARGWGEFLDAIKVSTRRAHELMALAGFVEEHGLVDDGDGGQRVPTLVEAGIKQPPQLTLVPPPSDADEEPDGAIGDPEPEVQADRDSWCTPFAIAQDIGTWDLDPCSNARSHIQATRTYDLARDEDGIKLARFVKDTDRVFINPPYSCAAGGVLEWVRAYAHTRFCFLVRLDFSTQWFDELYKLAMGIYVPRRERVQFEPPPGVEASSNPFPHGLVYARFADVSTPVRDPEKYLVLRTVRS